MCQIKIARKASVGSKRVIWGEKFDAQEAENRGMNFFGGISAFIFEIFEMLDTVRTGVIFKTFQVADHFNRL